MQPRLSFVLIFIFAYLKFSVKAEFSPFQVVDEYVKQFKSGIENLCQWSDTYKYEKNDYVKSNHNATTAMGAAEEYDFIIVGGGTAGLTLAHRLSEEPKWRTLVLEAGGLETPITEVPAMQPQLQTTGYTWGYKTCPQKYACQGSKGKTCSVIKARALGGDTTINDMLYTRGHPRDYDLWAETGMKGWCWDNVLPYFKKIEDACVDDMDRKLRHYGGPIHLENIHPTEKVLAEHLLKAGQECGLERIDYNGKEHVGFGLPQVISKEGKRHSVAKAYLKPILQRTNLALMPHSQVVEILISPITKEANGVAYIHDGEMVIAKATKEVILAAGAINSPQLLLLSGVGPKEDLKQFGMECVKDLPVGKNLKDQISFLGLNFVYEKDDSHGVQKVETNTSSKSDEEREKVNHQHSETCEHVINTAQVVKEEQHKSEAEHQVHVVEESQHKSETEHKAQAVKEEQHKSEAEHQVHVVEEGQHKSETEHKAQAVKEEKQKSETEHHGYKKEHPKSKEEHLESKEHKSTKVQHKSETEHHEHKEEHHKSKGLEHSKEIVDVKDHHSHHRVESEHSFINQIGLRYDTNWDHQHKENKEEKQNLFWASHSEADIVEYLKNGKGPLSSTGLQLVGFVKTEFSKDKTEYPDVLLLIKKTNPKGGCYHYKGADLRDDLHDIFCKEYEGFNVEIVLLRPKSVGFMKLDDSDPYHQPFINPMALSDEEEYDVSTLMGGIKKVLKLIDSPAMQKLGVKLVKEKIPECDQAVFNDEYWKCAIKYMSVTRGQITGTAKMGIKTAKDAVVDEELKVYGISKLRVADSSVIPCSISGNLMAPEIMIAEKAADIVKKCWES